tara:strand:+ start:1356 stop:1880 length:525 start_codon:yes stop_codon:yes gene_type:complete
MTQKDSFVYICNLTTSVLGLRKGSLSYKSRVQPLQIARMVAGVIARKEEGIHRKTIAEVLNRDRTLVYHYEKQHVGNYGWEKYREAYNKVYLAYHRLENNKKVFNDPHIMKEFLLRKGVTEHHKKDLVILIKSGKVGCGIKTSYFDFSNQLEKIKEILKSENYKYEIADIVVTK